MPTSDRPGGTVVLALGNPLMGDDGLGPAVLNRLQGWEWSGDLSIVDGETWGLKLLPTVEAADRLLVIDAIDIGAAPGTVVRVEASDLPRRLDTAMSPHQIGLRDVLALAALRGTYPTALTAIGAQPERVIFGQSLSPAVAGAVDAIVEAATGQLTAWGHARGCHRSRGGPLCA
jgi:hydrogenase maturation protease